MSFLSRIGQDSAYLSSSKLTPIACRRIAYLVVRMQHLAAHTASTHRLHPVGQRYLIALSHQLEPQTLPHARCQWPSRPRSSLVTQLECSRRAAVNLRWFERLACDAANKPPHSWPHSLCARISSRQQSLVQVTTTGFPPGSGVRRLSCASVNRSSGACRASDNSEGPEATVTGEGVGEEQFVVLNFYHLTQLEDPHATVEQHRAFMEVRK